MGKFWELTVFLRVVAEGSFSGAGRALGMSASAVSKLIARLEGRLDVRLFERIGGVIRLAPEGEKLQSAGKRVVEAMEDAENAVVSNKTEVTGVVSIHTALTTAKYLIAPKLPALLKQYPMLRLKFLLDTERGDFRKDGIDIAIHSGRPTELSLVGRPLMRRPWIIAASPDYLCRYGHPKSPDDLRHHRCLNFTIRIQWNSWTFHEEDDIKTVDIPNFIGANQGELLRTLALRGLGVVRLAKFHIEADLTQGTLVPLLTSYQEQSDDDRFYLLYLQGRSVAPRVRAVIDFFCKEFSD